MAPTNPAFLVVHIREGWTLGPYRWADASLIHETNPGTIVARVPEGKQAT